MYIYFIIQELSAGLVSGIRSLTKSTLDSDNHTGMLINTINDIHIS